MRRGWLVRMWMVAGALALASSAGSLAQSASKTLKFDEECLDLDTGTQAACGSGAATGWDIAVAANSLRAVQAVLFHNTGGGVQVAFLAGADFAAVLVDDVAVATFQTDIMDIPMDGSGVYLVRTDQGAVFKLGQPGETAGAASVTFELLEGGAQ